MYTEEQGAGVVVPSGTAVLALEDFSGAAAVHGEFLIARRIKIRRLLFVVQTAVVGTSTAPVVRFLRRPTPGSTTAQVVLGTLTIPNGALPGQVYYKDISPVNLVVGDALGLENSVAAAGGTPAGTGAYAYELELDPETPANEAKMILSI